MVKVNVKWNKQVFSDLELDENESVETFKTQLWTLTSVPVERQKLMARGAWVGTLKNDADFSKCKLKEGMQIMLMGSAEVVQAPAEKVVFLEDMSEAEQAQTGALLPSGMVNLGNTCYMNSTLECLRYVPELRSALGNKAAAPSPDDGPSGNFARALAETYRGLDASTESAPPVVFVQVLRGLFPQFAQQGPRGGYMQQDAEELYSAVQTTLAQVRARGGGGRQRRRAGVCPPPGTNKRPPSERRLAPHAQRPHSDRASLKATQVLRARNATPRRRRPPPPPRVLKEPAGGLPGLGGAENLVDALFGLEVEETLTCEECPEEPAVVRSDLVRKLVCNIQGGAGSAVNVAHLHEGVKLGFEGTIEKHSDILGHSAVCSQRRRLPADACASSSCASTGRPPPTPWTTPASSARS
ncbi:unnamed protein product [Heterosigma akashiwo]